MKAFALLVFVVVAPTCADSIVDAMSFVARAVGL